MDPLLPTDILGKLSPLFGGLDSKSVSLVYTLIFHGLNNMNLFKISYFSLVYSALLILFEYQQDSDKLSILLNFFLYKFCNFYLIVSLKLNFETLFESIKDP